MKRIKIAFYTVVDPLDKRSWSGIPYYLGKALQKHGCKVDFLGPVPMPAFLDKFFRAIAKLTRLLFDAEYYVKHSLLWGWYAAGVIRKRMKGQTYDCIIAPGAPTELAFLKKTSVPVVYAMDATFNLLSNYYLEDYKKICSLSRWEGNYLERKALQKSALTIYASHWAANSAVSDYNYNRDNIFITPLGANMDFVPSGDIIYKKQENETLTLLYLAVDWERKGGAIAFETSLYLNNVYGIKTKLVVCGCVPPEGFNHPYMEVIPFLNKNIPEDHQQFVNLLSSTHFLILPTRADCSLIVACESNAYGIPVITTDTGGVSDVVKNGVNGYCLSYEAKSSEYARIISEIYSDKPRYNKLISECRMRFEECLNWDVWTKHFLNLYNARLAHKTETMDVQETAYKSGVNILYA